jgi:opacity protein-like surface antigen/outer membrane protein OmpA-like peptidoglycan-associated protein
MKLTAALVVVAVTLTGPPAWSQEHPKAEVSVDYSFFHFQAFDYESFSGKYEFGQAYNLNGGGGSFVYNFGPIIGIKGEFQGYGSETRTVVVPPGNAFNPAGASAAVNGDIFTYMFGPQFGKRSGIFRPYGQALFGGAHSDVYSKAYSNLGFTQFGSAPSSNAFAMDFGAGLDIAVSPHFSIRPFEASYLYTTFNNHLSANENSTRFLAGVVFNMGVKPPLQLTVACSANPTSVFPGEPVAVTATVGSQDPKLGVVYSISGDGVTGANSSASATANTADLTPGQHTVRCDAKEGKPGKEGAKPWQVATQSTATFTVKEFEPPTISCSVSPTTIKPGDSATVTATGTSPQNRPLTFTYTSSAGSVNASGASGTFSSTGAPTGPVSITCSVSDDKGHNASANTSLTILAPPPPPQPHTQALCSINFETDKARPTRVDNEAKACLDEVALDLQRQSDAKAVVVGATNAKEKDKMEKQQKYAEKHKKAKVEDFAAQRAVNTKDYLVKEKGVDPSRISVATSTTDGQKVEDYLVPAGANFSSDVQGTTPVDETAVKPQERKPLPQRHHAHHGAAASK